MSSFKHGDLQMGMNVMTLVKTSIVPVDEGFSSFSLASQGVKSDNSIVLPVLFFVLKYKG